MASLPAKHRQRLRFVGGGTGLFTVLSGFRVHAPGTELAAIVSMMDSGGSTGRLRAELGVLPPGDVRKCLVALSDAPRDLLALFEHRFESSGHLSGHSLGNLVLSAAKSVAGGEYEAIELLERILLVRGHVYPVTLDDCHLVAELEDGTEIVGEASIDVRSDDGGAPIRAVHLRPAARIFSRAARALLDADYIVVGPGDLYTSVLPNLVVDGMRETLVEARRRGAKLLYVTNTMTKRGETDGYGTARFVASVEDTVGARLDAVVVNVGPVPEGLTDAYAKEGATAVHHDLVDGGRLVLKGDLMSREQFARHDPRRLALALLATIRRLPPRARAAG
ncbi:MAG: YvcK family protein [Polyangiaceae bacterium]|nr:YvcK family protein [Polyangiaceae bacterium]